MNDIHKGGVTDVQTDRGIGVLEVGFSGVQSWAEKEMYKTKSLKMHKDRFLLYVYTQLSQQPKSQDGLHQIYPIYHN